MKVPNFESLLVGALASGGLSLGMLDGTMQGNIFVAGMLLVGIPLAFLFLMYSNPKQQGNFNIGLVLAFPFCVILSPVLGLTMLLNKPWNSPQWKNREGEKSNDDSDPKSDEDEAP